MQCLKCGRDTESEQVFCNDCLQFMKAYPVKPGTAVQLPKRSVAEEPKKRARRRALSPEEQVAQLRMALHRIIAAAVFLLAALAIVTAMYVYEISLPNALTPHDWGRNYTAAGQENP